MPKRAAGVVQSDKSVQAFEAIVKQAYSRVYETVESSTPTSRARRAKILTQIKEIAAETQLDMDAWATVNIPAFYEQGAHEALETLVKAGAPITPGNEFVNFHREAIAAIAQDTRGSIAQAMAGLTATGEKLLGNAARESIMREIATGRILGTTRSNISKEIQKELRKEGITGLVDRGGRPWDLNSYSRMLARTKLTQAHNSGVQARMNEHGYDLVIVSNHFGSCAQCAPYESRVLSTSGTHESYGSLEDAKSNGLFHPNCRHVITPFHSSYLESSVVWDAEAQEYVPWNDLNKTDSPKPSVTAIKKSIKKKKAPAKISVSKFEGDTKAAFKNLGEKAPEFNDFESSLFKDRGTKLEITRAAKRNQGAYSPSDNIVELRRNAINAERTLMHEVGHAIDYTYRVAKVEKRTISSTYNYERKIHDLLTTDSDVILALKKNKDAIVRDRLSETITKLKEYKIDDQGIEQYLKGKQVVVSSGGYFKMSASYRRYVGSTKELFADGYAQYRINPKGFKKYAPETHAVFEKITKNYAKN